MDWRIIAVFTPTLFVLYQALSKYFPANSPIFLINAIASAVGTVVMLLLHFFFASKNSTLGVNTITTAVVIGGLISIGNFLIIKAYSMGATQSGFTSIFYPLLIIYGVSAGLLFWHEKLSMYQILGLSLALIGVFLMVYFRK